MAGERLGSAEEDGVAVLQRGCGCIKHSRSNPTQRQREVRLSSDRKRLTWEARGLGGGLATMLSRSKVRHVLISEVRKVEVGRECVSAPIEFSRDAWPVQEHLTISLQLKELTADDVDTENSALNDQKRRRRLDLTFTCEETFGLALAALRELVSAAQGGYKVYMRYPERAGAKKERRSLKGNHPREKRPVAILSPLVESSSISASTDAQGADAGADAPWSGSQAVACDGDRSCFEDQKADRILTGIAGRPWDRISNRTSDRIANCLADRLANQLWDTETRPAIASPHEFHPSASSSTSIGTSTGTTNPIEEDEEAKWPSIWNQLSSSRERRWNQLPPPVCKTTPSRACKTSPPPTCETSRRIQEARDSMKSARAPEVPLWRSPRSPEIPRPMLRASPCSLASPSNLFARSLALGALVRHCMNSNRLSIERRRLRLARAQRTRQRPCR